MGPELHMYWDQRLTTGKSPFDSRPECEASYLENRIPATITPRKSSWSRIRAKLISSSRFGLEKLHCPAQRGRRSAGVISTCCQIPRHPENSGQIRKIRPQKAFEVLNQPGGDDRGPSPRNPKSPTTPQPFQRRGTHLKAGSSMKPGQKISKPPQGPEEIAISIRSLGQAQPTSNARTHRSEENPISPGRKLVKKPLGVFDPRRTIPQTMKGGTLSTLSTTPRPIIRGNAELLDRDQPNRWHTTKSHDEQAETETSQQGDKVLRQNIVHELSKSKDVESGKVWHLDFHPHQQNFNKSDSGFCRSSMQHGNSIVTSFRAVECEIPTGTGSSLS
ncbi:hypothetical protein F2Q68_00010849 [Brassica cretica]|uniref:Uncharacterized protein n=1 Tax=Brassica cretica TaxID=69181 RepID=A0A8S9KY79_BRACR|nr:hypothetical protein F2Q68_00010849 [Brassica cretica]